MIARLQKSTQDKDKGFTLVELLIVIVIIGILAGFAIPMFLSQQKKAVDAGIKADLNAIAQAEENYRIDERKYSSTRVDVETGNDPVNLTDGNSIVVRVNATGDLFCLEGTNPDASKTWYYAKDVAGVKSTAAGICADATLMATAGETWVAP